MKKLQIDILFLLLVIILTLVVSHLTNHGRFGLSPDSCDYINRALNFAHGNGIVGDGWNPSLEQLKHPSTSQPPLYSILIAGLYKLGISGKVAAWSISYGAMLGCIALVYLLARRLDGLRTALWAGFFAATTVSFLNKGFWAWTETSFTFLILLALFFYPRPVCSADKPKTYSFRAFLPSAVFLILSVYVRYIGLFAILPFLLTLLTATYFRRIRLKIPVYFCLLIMVGLLPLFLRNVYLTGHPLGEERAAASETFWMNLSTAANGIMGVFLGGLSRWPIWLNPGPAHAYMSFIVLFLLSLIYVVSLFQKNRLSLILGLILITIWSTVILRSVQHFDPLDSHGCRLLSQIFPLIAILLAVFVRFLERALVSANRSRFIRIVTSLLIASGFLMLQMAYSQGLAADYARTGIQSAPETLAAVKTWIPPQSRLFVNNNAIQIKAEYPDYPLYFLPEISANRPEGMNRQNFRKLMDPARQYWLVFCWHPEIPIARQANYGPYLRELLQKGGNTEFTLVGQYRDGIIFKSALASKIQ